MREGEREREAEKRKKGVLVVPGLKTKTVNAALCLSHLDQGFSYIFISRTPKRTHLMPWVPILLDFVSKTSNMAFFALND